MGITAAGRNPTGCELWGVGSEQIVPNPNTTKKQIPRWWIVVTDSGGLDQRYDTYRQNVSENACGSMQALLVFRYKHRIISVLNYALCHEWRDSCTLDGGGEVSRTCQSTLGVIVTVPAVQDLGRPHNWSELWRRENLLPMLGMQPRLLMHLGHSQTAD
jgi:hypothetical protein